MSQPSGSTGVKRREFLKIVGATGAAAATVGCTSDYVQHLVPYTVSPDQTVPGVSAYYTTTCRGCAAACGIIAEVRDGRVIKLEGNPEHPLSRGAICARGQSEVQGLYNPDRFRGPMVRQGGKLVPTTWQNAMQLFTQKLGEVKSRGQAANVAFVNQHESGSFPGFLDGWLAAQGMPAHIAYDASAHAAVQEANKQSYGVAWPGLDFGAARLVVSFGADFMDDWGATVTHQLDYADARAKIEDAPRLVYVGPRRSLTGLNADEWLACKPGTELAIVNALRGALPVQQAAEQAGVDAAQLQRLVAEAGAAKPSLFLAGGRTANALDLALAVNALNQQAGNVGTTVRPDRAIVSFEGASAAADVLALAQRMAAGQVPLLMVRGVNPAFSLPTAAGFAEAMAKVPFKVSFSLFPDETTELCDLVLPDNHALESWGDAQAMRDVASLQQPGMDPVFDTRATADVLLEAAKGDPALAARYGAPNYRTWLMGRFPGGEQAFTQALVKGVAPVAIPGAIPTGGARRAAPAQPATPATLDATSGDFYFVVYPSSLLGYGEGANKPWLQELPDPVAKICWQTWIEMHPSTGKKLDVKAGDLVTVKTARGSITAPVYLYLGIRPDTVAMPIGRGHTAYGRYAEGVGVNPLRVVPVVTDAAGDVALTVTKAQVSKADGYEPLVTTEGSARQHERGIGQALVLTAGGLKAASGGGHAAEIAPEGGPETPAGEGAQAAGTPTAPQPLVAPPGEPTHSPTEGTGGGYGMPGQTGAVPGGGEEHLVGDASHAFLPGLRSPVANDAQGDMGDPTSKDKGMYDPNHWSGMAKRRWAMTIDLSRCTGCSACVTACYSENNIPTVGAPYQGRALAPGQWDTRPGANILKGREMNWIRLERYYEGAPNADSAFETDFDTRFVPMLCQHCGNAPCEPVCPVFATYHSPDGLNVQVYNRCVGTRYCSNNCPYKVRYFNWFGYGEPNRRQYAWPAPLDWALNPDVTVRGKGVMEKCSFCVQRIREAENRAKVEHRDLLPNEFTTACAQACPSRAITFGDAADENWSVTKLIDDRRAYHVFEELNTYTAVVYLKKVIHPAPASPANA